MDTDPTGLVGVGYQGASIDGFVADLFDQGVRTLVDVRLNPISRRFGFSKTRLAAAVEAAGIEYLHYRALGNPTINRAGFADLEGTAGKMARRRFAALLSEPEARAALEMLAALSEDQLVAVLCFEADQVACHRAVVIEHVQALVAGWDQKSGKAAASAAFG